MRDGVRVRPVLALIGFTAAIAQIVLMRELMVVFCGNEISLGLMLGSWLFWTAVGSGIAGRFAREPRRLMASLEALVAVALPATILAVRASRAALATVPGESLGPGPMLLGSLATLSLFCVLSGALFAAGSRLYGDDVATSTGSVYLLEALGSAAGGMLAGLVLVRTVAPLEIALGLGLLNLLAAASLVIRSRLARGAAMGALAGIAVLLALPFGIPRLEAVSLARFWRGFHLVADRNSVYGNLAVVRTDGVSSLYENGLDLFNVPDPAAAEEAVHYALLEHPWPRSLLLIGGGVNGSLAEALKHASLERVDYVELDPAILDLFPIRSDPRVHVHVTDGRLFLKTTASTFDVIIVNLPDPQTAQLNRFYTLEFFREAARKLTGSGVLALRLTAAEDYISPELAAFLRSIYKTLRAVFPEVTAIPGENVLFFGAKRPGVLAAGSEELLARLRARHLKTSYVREYYIPFRMMPDRMADLDRQIEPRPETPVNRDFAPVAYYFDVALWSSQFNHGYRDLFSAMAGVDFRWLAGGLGALLLVLAAKKRRARTAAACCTAAMGFTHDRAGDAAPACLPGDLRVRLPAACGHHCRLHGGDGAGQLAGVARAGEAGDTHPRVLAGWGGHGAAATLRGVRGRQPGGVSRIGPPLRDAGRLRVSGGQQDLFARAIRGRSTHSTWRGPAWARCCSASAWSRCSAFSKRRCWRRW